jgi:Glycosyl hydrolase family 76
MGKLAAGMAAVIVAVGVAAWEAGLFAGTPDAARIDGLLLVRPEFAHDGALPPAPPLQLTGQGQQAQLARAANNAARELAGSGDNSRVSFNPKAGLWAREFRPVGASAKWPVPVWWQSAIALDVLVRYLTAANDAQPQFQAVIGHTYQAGIRMPGSHSPRDFANTFMDDTAWWGLAWLDASRYELAVRHDETLAQRYLNVAATDASYIYSRPRACHSQGIEWQVGYPPDTITNAQFVALAAGLARTEDTAGPLADPGQGQMWLGRAEAILGWLDSSGLVNMTRGTVADSYSGHCRPTGGPLTYTEGEMAEALTQMGLTTGDVSYLNEAELFINRVLSPSFGMSKDGVLEEPCEARASLCDRLPHVYDAASYKGIFVQAVSDWTQATGSDLHDRFLSAQAQAVLANAASDGTARTSCLWSAHDCQLGFYWARRLVPSRWPIVPTVGSQESGLMALTGALESASTQGLGPLPSSSGEGGADL